MWYAIFIVAGLSLGLGMMIWALLERKKRYAAETKAAEYKIIADNNVVRVDEVLSNLTQVESERDLLAAEVIKMRDFIADNVDPEVLYEYVKSELNGTEI